MKDYCCPICHNKVFGFLFSQEQWSVYECSECKLAVTHPIPDPKTLAKLYDDSYFKPNSDSYDTSSSSLKKKVKQERHRVRFVEKHARKGKLLDIGCGNGLFLYAVKQKGFSVQGLDISDSNQKLIKDHFQIDVDVSPVEDMDYPENTFDVITMWHSLEHNRDPKEIIKRSLKWLKKDGTLIIEVPNHNCIDAKMNGEKWPNWAVPFHLYHFTETAIAKLITQCDLKIIGQNTYLSEYVKEQLENEFYLKPFARLIAKRFAGGGIACACKR